MVNKKPRKAFAFRVLCHQKSFIKRTLESCTPSPIQTILSVPESHRIGCHPPHKEQRQFADFTAGKEFHLPPKTFVFLSMKIILQLKTSVNDFYKRIQIAFIGLV